MMLWSESTAAPAGRETAEMLVVDDKVELQGLESEASLVCSSRQACLLDTSPGFKGGHPAAF